MIKVLYKRPGSDPEELKIDPTVENFRNMVGGHFEVSHIYIGSKIFSFYCNENGKWQNLDPNFANVVEGRVRDVIVGPVVFFRIAGENEASLSDSDVDVLKNWLALYSFNNGCGRIDKPDIEPKIEPDMSELKRSLRSFFIGIGGIFALTVNFILSAALVGSLC